MNKSKQSSITKIKPLSAKSLSEIKKPEAIKVNSVVDKVNDLRAKLKSEKQREVIGSLPRGAKIEDTAYDQININYKKLEVKYQPIFEKDIIKKYAKDGKTVVLTNDGQKYVV